MILPILFIAPSAKGGRGVFSSEKIKAGTVIEISPVLVLSINDRKFIEQTKLFNYIFEWGNSRRKAAIAFGYISMYNHDYDANCSYDMDFDNDLMTLTTVKDIDKGEEIYINYNAAPSDKTPLWFNAK